MPESIVGEYRLLSHNGKMDGFNEVKMSFAPAKNGRGLEFGAKICNTMGGDCTFENGVLRGNFFGTMMYGPEHLMQVEQVLGQGIGEGIAAQRVGRQLTLTSKGHTLILEAK